jgi:hypothetical protein
MVTGPFSNLRSQKPPLQNGIDSVGGLERFVKSEKYVISITYNYVAKNIMAGGRRADVAANGG